MKTGKRIVSILLVALMLLTAAPLADLVGLEVAPKIKAYNAGDLIQYGAYPQSRVNETEALKAAAEAATWKSYGYYCGSLPDGWVSGQGLMEPSDCMSYTDFFFLGNKYRAVRINEYRPYLTEKEAIASNSFQDEHGYFAGETYYFKYEPLWWKVLDPSTGLIRSENIIDAQPFQNTLYDSWKDEAHSVAANDYTQSDIREWLNHDFYDTAFTETQKSNILNSKITNHGYNSPDHPDCEDFIFLLSYLDTFNTSFGFSANGWNGGEMQRKHTDYAKCQGLFVIWEAAYRDCAFTWTRTSHSSGSKVYTIGCFGNAASMSPVIETGGVRPVCCLSTIKSDYTVTDNSLENCAVFPAGYQWRSDKLKFNNPTEEINKKVYTDLLGTMKGSKFYIIDATASHGKPGSGGLCFGMSTVTGALLDSSVSLSGFGNEGQYTSINELSTSSDYSEFKNIKNDITLIDLIKYAYVYQYDYEVSKSKGNDLNQLYSSVLDYMVHGGSPILINIRGAIGHGFHAVLAVGILEETDNTVKIILDDSNYNDPIFSSRELRYLILKKENGSFVGWEFEKEQDDIYASDQLASKLSFYTPTSSFVNRMNHLDQQNENAILITDQTDEMTDTIANEIELAGSISDSATSSIRCYWIDDPSQSIRLSTRESCFYELVGNTASVAANVNEGDSLYLKTDKASADYAEIKGTSGENVSFSYSTVTDNDTIAKISVSGQIHDEICSITETEEGVSVLGLDHFNVLYSLEDEPLSETTVNVNDGQMIRLFINEEEHSISTDYLPTHTYFSAVTTEPTCTADGETTYTCSICGDTYTEPIPATGEHIDDDNDGYCDACEEMMQGGQHCKFCGKIHDGIFGWLVKIFHSIFAIFKR